MQKISMIVTLVLISAYIIAAGVQQGLLFVAICLLLGAVYRLAHRRRE